MRSHVWRVVLLSIAPARHRPLNATSAVPLLKRYSTFQSTRRGLIFICPYCTRVLRGRTAESSESYILHPHTDRLSASFEVRCLLPGGVTLLRTIVARNKQDLAKIADSHGWVVDSVRYASNDAVPDFVPLRASAKYVPFEWRAS